MQVATKTQRTEVTPVTEERGVLTSSIMEGARTVAIYEFRYWRRIISTLTFYENNNDSCPTAKIDQRMRVQINGPWFLGLSVNQRAAVLVHEAAHIIMKHRHREKVFLPLNPVLLNICADYEINSGPKLWNYLQDGPEPQGIHPSKAGWEEGRSFEYYVQKMLEQIEEEEEEEGDGGGDGEDTYTEGGYPGGSDDDNKGTATHDDDNNDNDGSGDGNGGSTDSGGTDNSGEDDDSTDVGPPGVAGKGTGIPKGHEAPLGGGGGCEDIDDSLGDLPGMPEHETEKVVRRTVRDMVESHARSQVGAGYFEYAVDSLKPPKVPWQSILQGLLGSAIEGWKRGMEDKSYAAQGRRGNPDIIMPGWYSPEPSITVVVDTSGSMGRLLEDCASEIASLLREQSDIFFVAFDTRVTAAQKVRRIEDLCFKGGGGTCMDVALEKVCDETFCQENEIHKPDLVVLLTDCETGWPSSPLDTRIIVVGVGNSYYNRREYIPMWMDYVKVEKE